MLALHRVCVFPLVPTVLVLIVAGFSGVERLVWFSVKMVTGKVMSG